MNRASLIVVKVGGSLLDWAELPSRLGRFLLELRASSPDARPVLIAGGGTVVDSIRRLDRVHRLDPEVAHRLAIHAMDLTSAVLLCILPGSRTVDRLASLEGEWESDEIPLLVPSCILEELGETHENPLPTTWDVTSDSIAAWIAGCLKAESLILLKSASLPPGATRDLAARRKLVDPFFPLISTHVARVEYLNLRDPSAAPEPLP